MKGSIQTLFIAVCGTCDLEPMRLEKAYSKTSAARLLREKGWQYTQIHGWVCYDCVTGKKAARG